MSVNFVLEHALHNIQTKAKSFVGVKPNTRYVTIRNEKILSKTSDTECKPLLLDYYIEENVLTGNSPGTPIVMRLLLNVVHNIKL